MTVYQKYTDYWNLCTKLGAELKLLSSSDWEQHYLTLLEQT